MYNYQQNVTSAKHENKVLAINKNSLGWSDYLYNFLLVRCVQVCFKREMRQKTRVPPLSEHGPTGPEYCQQSWGMAVMFNDSPRKGEGINQVHHSSMVQTGSPMSRGCDRIVADAVQISLWAGDSDVSAQSGAEMGLLEPWAAWGVLREIKASLFTQGPDKYLPLFLVSRKVLYSANL